MSDDEYDDELPPISVNTSFSRDSQELLRMPTAEELASQRAREAECERELQALRASDTEVCLHTADSSGSEGEAALAAAVTALRVKAAARAGPPSLVDLLTPMLAHTLREATPAALATLTQDVCEATVSAQVHSREEVAVAAVWLCAASVGASSRDLRRRSRRALHGLLGHGHFADPDGEASRALSAAVIGGNLGATTYLELADAVEAAPANAHFHRQLLLAALADLLQCKAQPEVLVAAQKLQLLFREL
ncbi:hypothetical protein ABMA27_009672 [Loxostege sticticalis]|uniref:Interferon-related developmental regulator N-terminal domain-containing protein n=1 Tax=Loxostege sticticalis TaxID=481309 RepID=A0ABR3H8T6_LOXSC